MSSIEKRLSQIEKQVEVIGKASQCGTFRDAETGWIIIAGHSGLITLPDNGRGGATDDNLPAFDWQRWETENGPRQVESIV